MGRRLRLAQQGRSTGRPSGRTGPLRGGESLLRHAGQPQPLRDSPPDSYRQESRDAGEAHRAIRPHVGEEGKDISLRSMDIDRITAYLRILRARVNPVNPVYVLERTLGLKL